VPRTPAQAIGFLLGFWLAFALSPLIVNTATGAEPSNLTVLEADLLAQANRVRGDHHLVPLVRRSDLDRVALAHSIDMARRGYFSHQSPEGDNAVNRLQQHGVTDMRLAAENLGKRRNRIRVLRSSRAGFNHLTTEATCSLQPSTSRESELREAPTAA